MVTSSTLEQIFFPKNLQYCYKYSVILIRSVQNVSINYTFGNTSIMLILIVITILCRRIILSNKLRYIEYMLFHSLVSLSYIPISSVCQYDLLCLSKDTKLGAGYSSCLIDINTARNFLWVQSARVTDTVECSSAFSMFMLVLNIAQISCDCLS